MLSNIRIKNAVKAYKSVNVRIKNAVEAYKNVKIINKFIYKNTAEEKYNNNNQINFFNALKYGFFSNGAETDNQHANAKIYNRILHNPRTIKQVYLFLEKSFIIMEASEQLSEKTFQIINSTKISIFKLLQLKNALNLFNKKLNKKQANNSKESKTAKLFKKLAKLNYPLSKKDKIIEYEMIKSFSSEANEFVDGFHEIINTQLTNQNLQRSFEDAKLYKVDELNEEQIKKITKFLNMLKNNIGEFKNLKDLENFLKEENIDENLEKLLKILLKFMKGDKSFIEFLNKIKKEKQQLKDLLEALFPNLYQKLLNKYNNLQQQSKKGKTISNKLKKLLKIFSIRKFSAVEMEEIGIKIEKIFERILKKLNNSIVKLENDIKDLVNKIEDPVKTFKDKLFEILEEYGSKIINKLVRRISENNMNSIQEENNKIARGKGEAEGESRSDKNETDIDRKGRDTNSQVSEKQNFNKIEKNNDNVSDKKASNIKLNDKQIEKFSKEIQRNTNDISTLSDAAKTVAKISDSPTLSAEYSKPIEASIVKLDSIRVSNSQNIETLSSVAKTDAAQQNLTIAKATNDTAAKNINEANKIVNDKQNVAQNVSVDFLQPLPDHPTPTPTSLDKGPKPKEKSQGEGAKER